MNKNKLSRLEKEIESKNIKGGVSYRKLENGKYLAVNTNDKEAIIKDFEYTFEDREIDPGDLFNSVEEIRERYGDEYEYKDVTKVHEEFNSHFE